MNGHANEGLADSELGDWVGALRQQQPHAEPQDLASLRAPRFRPDGPQLRSVRELRIDARPAVAVRLYRPGPERLPLVIYVHGGGFVSGDLDSHDRVCRRLALKSRAAVLAVDYRRAPEHPAPAAVDDLINVARWAAGLPAELGPVIPDLAVAGDSAGAAIAVLAAARLASASVRLSAVLLICPNADLTLAQPSVSAKGSGWGLDEEALRWFVRQWTPDLSPEKPAPVQSSSRRPARVATTLVATAEHDPLRDEGAALVGHLRGLGVDASHLPHPGLIHGFFTLDAISPAANVAGDALIRQLGRLLPRVTAKNG
jgi:acetyl esterase